VDVIGAVALVPPRLLIALVAQVDEGDTSVINIRESDDRLEPLVFGLAGLGGLSLVATIIYWWFTRPGRYPDLSMDPAPQTGTESSSGILS